jgi:hypothetical protein
MQMFQARQSVQDGLTHLATRLDPIITKRLAGDLGGLSWTVVLSELDTAKGYVGKTYETWDLQAQLRIITERLGGLRYPFDDPTRLVSTLGGELRIVRNRWAHNDTFTALDAWRLHDFAARLLAHLGDVDGLAVAEQSRLAAIGAVVDEVGIEPKSLDTVTAPAAAMVAEVKAIDDEVEPDESVLIRHGGAPTPIIGTSRSQFEPWTSVPVGDVSVLDNLPKKVAKEQVRSVAIEIAVFEGPIHIDRLAQLTALAFGVQRLHVNRAQKLYRQIKASGLAVDSQKFVWPESIDPGTWNEFRPNAGDADRPFLHISPVEIANAARFLIAETSTIGRNDLEAATLQTFGRKRRTKQVAEHLAASLGGV